MSKYIDAEALTTFLRGVRRRLPTDSSDFFTRDEMLLNFQQYVELASTAGVVEMPFQTDGIAMIYSDTIKVTNVEALAGKTLKAVLFHVTQEESDRYDAEAERIINERQTL